MCGIVGVYAFSKEGKSAFDHVKKAIKTLNKRGPDNNSIVEKEKVSLAHARLSIIDLSSTAHQPMTDKKGDYTIVFNGEIYNFPELRKELKQKGYEFKTSSDTEVLLNLYIEYGKTCLDKLNGFFAFAIYNEKQDVLFIARDRYGIKPLYWYKNKDHLVFGSEMKSLLSFDIKREINQKALFSYLQFNYIPAPLSIIEGIQKLPAGHCITINKNKTVTHCYYQINTTFITPHDYDYAKKNVKALIGASVEKRLISDVPIGCFLSGGIDSSVIATEASKRIKTLNTFSIGYKDEPYFDETSYAELVASKIKSNHTTFRLTNDDFFENFEEFNNYIDEPFGDSSALAVYILSKKTKEHVTVALSGDGADELFSGYNKHKALYNSSTKKISNQMIRNFKFLWKALPQSRNSKIGNLGRQLNRYADGLKLPSDQRYWRWASILSEKSVNELLISSDSNNSEQLKHEYTSHIQKQSPFSQYLVADFKLVLPNDMLYKVDIMSMANSLEVRTPFLDHELVNYVFSLPDKYKINGSMKKKILQDAYRNELPKELYNRPKRGFEVPLYKWFQSELKNTIDNELLSEDFVKQQGVFNPLEIKKLKSRLFSSNPGDSTATVWGLIVFQNWWKKYINK